MTVPPTTRKLSPETAFELMASPRRRHAVAVLVDADGPLDARTVARRVAARREDVRPEAVADERVDRTVLSLCHAHLPKLDEAGVVTYDDASGRVELGAASDAVEPLVEYAEGR